METTDHDYKVGQLVEINRSVNEVLNPEWEPAKVYAVGGLLGPRNIEVELKSGGVCATTVRRIRRVSTEGDNLMYVVHWVPNGGGQLNTYESPTRDEAEGYRSGLLAVGVQLVSEVTMSA